MTCLQVYYPSHYDNGRHKPYKKRVHLGKEYVDLICQFVKNSPRYNLKHNKSIRNIFGPPTKFPNYGNFKESCIAGVIGMNISIFPRQHQISWPPIPDHNSKIIDISYQEAVYPIGIFIYEVYNPGCIIQISAQDVNNKKKWFLLWNGLPQIVPPTSRIFSPPLRWCDFKTKLLRIKCKDSSWSYYTKIDAVMLIGTSELILPRNPEQSLTELLKKIICKYPCHKDIHNLTPDYKNAYFDISELQKKLCKYSIICKSNIKKDFHKAMLWPEQVAMKMTSRYVQSLKHKYGYRYLEEDYSKYTEFVKQIKPSSNNSQELSCCGFLALPAEIQLIILKYLDLTSLCRVSRVNKYLNNLTRDPLLYTSLSIIYVNVYLNLRRGAYNRENVKCFMNNIFCYFTPRCIHLRQLRLRNSYFSTWHFVKFLNACGKTLVHLHLDHLHSLNDFDDKLILCEISTTCKQLKELDLSNCRWINDGFLFLENLECLEHLNLSYTQIKSQHVCKVLRRNRRLRELILEHSRMELDPIAMELKNSNPELEVINLEEAHNILSWRGINALADCKNLRKVNFNWLNQWSEEVVFPVTTNLNDWQIGYKSLQKLLFSCQRLEEIKLNGFNLKNAAWKELMHCKNLKELYVFKNKYGWDLKQPIAYNAIFNQCPKLERIDDKCRSDYYL